MPISLPKEYDGTELRKRLVNRIHFVNIGGKNIINWFYLDKMAW